LLFEACLVSGHCAERALSHEWSRLYAGRDCVRKGVGNHTVANDAFKSARGLLSVTFTASTTPITWKV